MKQTKFFNLAKEFFSDKKFSDSEVNFLNISTEYERDFDELKIEKEKDEFDSNLIRWVCTDSNAKEFIDSKGILVCNANIQDVLDLEDLVLPFSMVFFNCKIKKGLILRDSNVRNILFYNCEIGEILADRVTVNGFLNFDNLMGFF